MKDELKFIEHRIFNLFILFFKSPLVRGLVIGFYNF